MKTINYQFSSKVGEIHTGEILRETINTYWIFIGSHTSEIIKTQIEILN